MFRCVAQYNSLVFQIKKRLEGSHLFEIFKKKTDKTKKHYYMIGKLKSFKKPYGLENVVRGVATCLKTQIQRNF